MFNLMRYYELHEHLANEHGLTLLDSQLEDIIIICKKLEREVAKQKVMIEVDVPEGQRLVSVDPTVGFQTNGASVFYIPKFEDIPTPAKKVIDMTCLIGSGIDCEFSDSDLNDPKLSCIGNLKKEEDCCYFDDAELIWEQCRIRQSPHVHFWKGDHRCPLPDGLKIGVWYLTDSNGNGRAITEDYLAEGFSWRKVIGFEVLGPAEGWRYEWEEECKE